jgi:hypothetical protein
METDAKRDKEIVSEGKCGYDWSVSENAKWKCRLIPFTVGIAAEFDSEYAKA